MTAITALPLGHQGLIASRLGLGAMGADFPPDAIVRVSVLVQSACSNKQQRRHKASVPLLLLLLLLLLIESLITSAYLQPGSLVKASA